MLALSHQSADQLFVSAGPRNLQELNFVTQPFKDAAQEGFRLAHVTSLKFKVNITAESLDQRARQLAEAAFPFKGVQQGLGVRSAASDSWPSPYGHGDACHVAVPPAAFKRRLLQEAPRLDIRSCFLHSLSALFPNLTHLALLGNRWRPVARRIQVAATEWPLSELQPIALYETELDRLDVLIELLRHLPALKHVEMTAPLLPCRWSANKHEQHRHLLGRLEQLTIHLDAPTTAANGNATGQSAITAAAAGRIHSLYAQLPGLRALTLVGGRHALSHLLPHLPPRLDRCTLRDCRISLGGASAAAPVSSRPACLGAAPGAGTRAAAVGVEAAAAAAPAAAGTRHQRWVARRTWCGALSWDLVEEPGPGPGMGLQAIGNGIAGGGAAAAAVPPPAAPSTLRAAAAAADAFGRWRGGGGGSVTGRAEPPPASASSEDGDVAVSELVVEPASRRLSLSLPGAAGLTEPQLLQLLNATIAGALAVAGGGGGGRGGHGSGDTHAAGGLAAPCGKGTVAAVAGAPGATASGASWSVRLGRLRLGAGAVAADGVVAAAGGGAASCSASEVEAEAEAVEAGWLPLLALLEAHRVQVAHLVCPLEVPPQRLAALLQRLAAPPSRLQLEIPPGFTPAVAAALAGPSAAAAAAIASTAAPTTNAAAVAAASPGEPRVGRAAGATAAAAGANRSYESAGAGKCRQDSVEAVGVMRLAAAVGASLAGLPTAKLPRRLGAARAEGQLRLGAGPVALAPAASDADAALLVCKVLACWPPLQRRLETQCYGGPAACDA